MSEIVTWILPNQSIEGVTIKKLNFNFVKRKHNEFNSKFRTPFKVNIYIANNNEIGEKIYSSEAFLIDAYRKEKIEVNLSNENIELNKN